MAPKNVLASCKVGLLLHSPSVFIIYQGKGNAESPKVLDTLPDLFHWLHSNPHSIPVEAHSILEQYLNMASQQPDEQGAGLVGVVSIIKEAVNGKDRATQLHLCEIMIFTQW